MSTGQFDDERVVELLERVQELTDAKEWEAAEPVARELLDRLPRSHWANARMSQVAAARYGERAALPYARTALDTGFCCATCSGQIADVLYSCGDYVRATVASAIVLILGGTAPPRLATREVREEAVRFVVTYVENGKAAGTVDGPAMDGLHALALGRSGELERSYRAFSVLPPDALVGTNYDVEVQTAVLEYRLGLLTRARQRLQARSRAGYPAQALSYLALVTGAGRWTEVMPVAELAVKRASERTGSGGILDLLVATSALSICHFLNDAPERGHATLKPFAREPHIKNLLTVAQALAAVATRRTVDATSLLLQTASWDETGDIGLPCAQEALQRLTVALDGNRDLTSLHATAKLEDLMVVDVEVWEGARDLDSIAHNERELTAIEQLLGADHGTTDEARADLAVLYWNAGRAQDAVPLEEAVVRFRSEKYGDDDERTMRARVSLAISYESVNRRATAIALREGVVQRRARNLGDGDISTIKDRIALGVSYHDAGHRQAEAVAALERALRDGDRSLGPAHDEMVRACDLLGGWYFDDKRYSDAIRLRRRVVTHHESRVGGDSANDDLIAARRDLAMAYWYAGRPNDAIPLEQQVLSDIAAARGRDHPDTITACRNLAMSYNSVGDHTKEVPLRERVAVYRAKALGAQHADTLEAQQDLALARRAAGMW